MLQPHLRAALARSRASLRSRGPGALLAGLVPVLGGGAALVVLARPVFLAFLDGDPEGIPAGIEAVVLRFALVLVSALTLEVYAALIRSPDRRVLEILPVDPAGVVWVEVLRVGLTRSWLLVLGMALLLPLALEVSVGAWALGAAVLAGVWVAGLPVSASLHLLAVLAAESPRMAPSLDLLRGSNPREQAALIYAPGFVLATLGGLVFLGARGVRWGLEGAPLRAALALLAPLLVAGLASLPVALVARRSWFRASAVLADIDARYGALVDREEGRRVYLDWAVRFLPVAWAPYALRDLRHGWRARRTWITATWVGGIGGALAGWTVLPAGPGRAAAAGAAVALGAAAVGVVLEREEPEFLRAWLPSGGVAARGARLAVLLGWLQGAAWPAALAVAVRRSVLEGAFVLGVVEAAALVGASLALAAGLLRERGLWVYGPLAAVLAAVLALWVLQ